MFVTMERLLLLLATLSCARPEYGSIGRHAGDPHHELAQLRDGKEMSVHLKSGETKQYSFQIRGGDTSLWLVVTPCGGTLKWKVTHQSEDGHIVEEADTEDEGSGQQSMDAKRDYLAPTTDHLGTAGPRIRVNQVREATLVRDVGRSSMEYVRESMPSGVLHLYITSGEENDTTARVYVTTDLSKIDAYFPKLPRRQRITLSNITDRQVTLSWEHSPSVNLFKQNDIRYCLALSATKEYATYCEVLEEQERRSRKQKQQSSKDNNFLRDQSGSSTNDQKLTVMCTQYKTGYQFTDLESDTKYHLSLFAVNTKTGGASAYAGSSFVTRNSKSAGSVSDTAPVRLRDGQMYASYLNPARASFRLYEIHVQHFRRQILISVQPCSGYIRVNLYKDGQLLRKSAFSELKVFAVTNVKPGILRIKVVNDDNDAKIYKIWSSVRPSRNPYPVLPFDTSIKSLETGRSCTSVTLAWLGSTQKHDYCLYRRMEREDYFKQLILEESDQCQGPSAKMEQVFCRRFKVENDSQLIMKAAVFDLKPATTYRFDLYASKPNRQPLSYRTVWVKTNPKCSLELFLKRPGFDFSGPKVTQKEYDL